MDHPSRPDELRAAGRLLLALLILVAAAESVIGRGFRRGDIFMADRTADPLFIGDPRGAIYLVANEPGLPIRVVVSAEGFVDPVTCLIREDGRIVVVDANVDFIGDRSARGGLFLVEPPDAPPGKATKLAADARWDNPTDILEEPSGDLLLLDADADVLNAGTRPGALFRVSRFNQEVTLVAASPLWAEPRSMVFDIDGKVLIWDPRADPFGLGGVPGALFRVDPVSGEVQALFSKRGVFATPWALAIDGAGNYLILDRDANPRGFPGAPGAIYRVRRTDLEVEVAFAVSNFIEPFDFVMDPDGSAWVLDRRASPSGNPQLGGGLFHCDLAAGVVIESQYHASFATLNGLTRFSAAPLDSTTIIWDDLSGPPLVPGDRVVVRARVRNSGREPGRATLRHPIGSAWDYRVASDSASVGSFAYDPASATASWVGNLAAQAEATVSYEVRLSESIVSGARIVEDFLLRMEEATSETAIRFETTSSRRSEPGRVIWTDYSSVGGQTHGLILDLPTGAVLPEEVFSGPPLVKPDDVAFLPGGRIAVLDRLSQPRGPDAARGGLYAVDPWAGSVDTLLAVADHPELRFPTGLAYGRTDELLLVDKDANPMGYPGRPGAVYSFDLQSRTLRLLAASDKFVEPSDVILESTGSVLIVDYEADPSGTQPRSGCLFEIDPLSGAVTPVPHQAYTFVDPIGLAEGPLRRVYVVDISANPRALPQNTGAVFQVIREAGNLTVLLSADTLYADPTDILVEDSGRIIVSDRESDPFDFGPGDHGALLSFFPHSGPVSVYAGHGTLRGPEGLALFREGSLSVSSLDLADINGPPALPGDSLRFEVLVSNAGPARIESAMASLYVSDRLSLIAVEGSPGIGLDPRAGGLTWLGDLEPAETARVGGWARINDDLVFGERIFGYTRIAGPGAPAPDTAGLRGVTYLGPGDVVLVDLNADLGAGTARGTLFFLREGEGETTPIISADPSWFDPTAVEYEGPGRLLMADPSGAGGGRIFSVDYLNGTSRIWISDPRLGTPVDLCMTRGGDLLIVDQLASLQNPTGQRPAIFIKRAGQSGLSVFTDHPALAAPDQLAEDDLGRLWLVDSQADPNGLQHGSGALFRIDAQTGALADTLQFREFVRPTGVVVWPEAGLAVVDGRARQLGPIGTGVIFQVDPDRETLGVRIEDPRFRLPRNAAFTLGGDLWIVDAIARDDALPGAPGTLFSYSPESGEIKTVAQSPDYVTPADLYIVPGPTPRFYSYDVEDLDGPPVEPGDEVRVTARIGNSGPVETRGVAYTDTLPAWVVLDPETIRYEAGTLQLLPELGVIVWNVDLGSETSYTITYEGRVRPEAPQGLEILFRSHLRTAEGVHRVRKASKRLPVFFEEEYLYLVDSDCDPFRFGKTVGALWKIHLRTGNTVTMASSESMVEPVACLMMPSSPPELFIVDELANPRGHAVGRGALWRLLPLESAIEVVSAEPTFRNPLTAIPIGDHELLLLDGLANPFNLPARFGPGAIYHVDTLTRETTPYHSDTLFVSPKDILLDGRGGLLVIDAEADPGGYGFRGGAVFRLDLIRKQVTVYSASADFRGPVAATIGPDGALYVLDRDAVAFEGTIARGVVWRIDRMGNAALFTASQFFRRPVDLAFDSSGNLMVSDEIADPAGYGEQHGAVFRRRGSSPSFDVFLASKRTASPAGFFIREGLTPLGLSDLEAEAADEGILLRWRVGEGQFDGFVILRASGSDPADEDYAPLNLDRLVPGMGPYEYLDEEIEPGTAYAYKIAAVLPGGGSRLYGPVHAVATAGRPFALHAAAPNPTRGSTSIRYSLPRKGDVRLQVFDLAGRRVRVLHDGPAGGGTKVLVWDGTNEQGRAVASGVYFLRLTWRDRSASGRVVLLR